MKRPSPWMRQDLVTLLKHTWGKDADAGRVITATQTVAGVPCSVTPGTATTLVDETGRWTRETPYTLNFTTDPGLKSHDELTWVERTPQGKLHNLVVHGTHNCAGMGVTFTVSCVERT